MLMALLGSTEAAAANTTYYVDAGQGSDANNGTSASTAWKTLAKVNATTFQPGDRILFEAGNTWTGQLYPKGSGSSGSPIVIDQYGSGEKPKIQGQGAVQATVYLYNQQYWEIHNLDISNQASSGVGDFRGVHITGADIGTLNYFRLDGLNVHDVTGEVNWIGGDTADNATGINFATGWDRSKRTGGIVFDMSSNVLSPAKATVKSKFNDVVISNSSIKNTSFGGIIFKQYTGDGLDHNGNPAVSVGWGVRSSASDTNWYPFTNITIKNNYITQSGTSFGCNGIYLTDTKGALIEGNVVAAAGTSGIETYYADDVVIQKNETYGVVKKAGGADYNGIDTDKGTTKQVVQYNYVHGNGDGILLCQFSFGDSIIRYNIITGNSRYQIYLHSDSAASSQIYNNTIYNTNSTYLIYGYGSYINASYTIRNNILDSAKSEAVLTTGGGIVYNTNSYYGSGLTVPSGDTNAKTANPLLVSPGTGSSGTETSGPALNTLSGYQLQSTSPLVNQGVTISGNGGLDFWGDTLYMGAADIGADETAVAGGGSTPVYALNETFNSLTTGSAPTGWTVTNGTSPNAITIAEVPDATHKSAQISKSAASAKTSMSKSFGAVSGTVVVETRVKRTETTSWWCLPYIYDNAGVLAATIGFDGGNIKANVGGTWTTVQAFTANTWYELKLVLDTNTDKFDFYVNGTLKLSQAALRAPVSNIAKIEFYADNSQTGTTHIDNISVYTP
ncbi:right-handed parallel beta-helix repeat-containing protein [Paenibacillus whitsoniae]|uniref:Right-handed parallel beta-helix repeat-containing protein n=2 Tax=Paenibacillus whitsoniae TaxID=2496558 RepID=A0A430JD56_9BACL|nr:right-handed parallel beta-helix repeat-containing protein [Paenibacillus whitsoniae]